MTPLYLGAAYYPEHWPKERWEEDVRLMAAAGMNVARMAEFAWSAMEPVEGQFQFDWLEEAIQLLAAEGIATVLGTPTAAPPAWLVQKNPDLLAVDEAGRRVQFGNRCHYCVNAPAFHNATRKLVAAMAERFGQNPHVIGWQIDNEYNRVCYCERCTARFQQYLAQHYKTLDALNASWTTAYWSQTYSDWNQIPIPIGYHNPGLMLAFRRFITYSYRRFQRLQIDILRKYIPEQTWITHNFMSFFEAFNHYPVAKDLDLASWDWYVASGHNDFARSAASLDLTRGLKLKNFWIMETQPGSVNWSPVNNMLNRGEARTMAWEAVAHGADAVLYWQWRSPLNGQEQYHGTLIDASGRPRPFYYDVLQLGREFKVASSALDGSSVKSEVAILHSWENRWGVEFQKHHRDFDYVQHLLHYHRPLIERNVSVDIVSPDASLYTYRLVIAPALHLLTPELADRLKEYVRRGGCLVLTVRSGMKDEHNALLPMRQPGYLAELAGVEVEDYYALDEPTPLEGRFNGVTRLWAERLSPLDGARVEVLAAHGASNGWLDGCPAITAARHGDGKIVFVGCYPDDALQNKLITYLLQESGVQPILKTPAGVQAGRRIRPDCSEIVILINHTRQEKTVKLPWKVADLLGSRLLEGSVVLEPYGVAVLVKEQI